MQPGDWYPVDNPNATGADNAVYWVNRNTQETSWSPPLVTSPPPKRSTRAAPAAEVAEEAPLWYPVEDTATGKTYYVNRDTKETSWKRPAQGGSRGGRAQPSAHHAGRGGSGSGGEYSTIDDEIQAYERGEVGDSEVSMGAQVI